MQLSDNPTMTLHLTREDVFNAAVQGCQPISIAIERVFQEQGMYAAAVMVAYDTAHVYVYGFRHVPKLHIPAPLSTFNRAYWTGQVITIEQPIYGELTDAEHYPLANPLA